MVLKSNILQIVKRRLPVIQWLPHYTFSFFFRDLLAGFTVALTKVPQSIAYATLAGLDPQYGLYSSFMGIFVYFFFGSCKEVNIGPTTVIGVMILPHVTEMGPDIAIMMTFFAGIVVLLFAILRVGFVLKFFSFPVISGFTTSVALQIMSTQVRSLLGTSGSGVTFLEAWISVIQNMRGSHFWDTIIGAVCLVFILTTKFLGKWKGSLHFKPEFTLTKNILSLFLWILSITSNAITVVIATVVVYCLSTADSTLVNVIGTVPGGLPQFSLPPFSTTYNNQSYTFINMVTQLGPTIVFLPIIGFLEHISVAKYVSQGKPVNATQELIALGLSNFFGCFLQSMPVSGTFSRTTINKVSGVKTTAGGLFTGAIILLVLSFMTSYFYYIPKTTLAAVVISAMTGLVEYETPYILWKTNKYELIPYCSTVLCCLLWNLEYGIITGILINALFILYSSTKPEIQIKYEVFKNKQLIIVVPESKLHYSSAEYLTKIIKSEGNISDSIVLLDGNKIKFVDTTTAKSIKTLLSDFSTNNKILLLWNFNEECVQTIISLDSDLKKYFVKGTMENVIFGISKFSEC